MHTHSLARDGTHSTSSVETKETYYRAKRDLGPLSRALAPTHSIAHRELFLTRSLTAIYSIAVFILFGYQGKHPQGAFLAFSQLACSLLHT
jgi:hypothetical protein